MQLSSNSIIHFTDSKESLKGILANDFKLSFCKETIELGSNPIEFYVPMVSFCDIPLSSIREHIQKYGYYGLGLTKEWAERNGLNPVLYVEKQSALAKSVSSVIKHVLSDGDVDDWSEHQRQVADIVRYIKNYQNDLIRRNTTINDYRFSDEREWRYCPPFDSKCDMILSTDYYSSEGNKQKADTEIEKYPLSFGPADIKYIVIKSETEISEFIDVLKKSKGNNYSYNDVERLTTRILTAEQIMSDF